MAKLWSQLSTATRAKYQKQGISAHRYNAWNKTSAATKKKYQALGLSRQSFLQSSNTKIAVTTAQQQNVTAHIISQIPDANPVSVADNVAGMTPAELRRTLRMSAGDIKQAARRPADRTDSTGRSFNPFWYH